MSGLLKAFKRKQDPSPPQPLPPVPSNHTQSQTPAPKENASAPMVRIQELYDAIGVANTNREMVHSLTTRLADTTEHYEGKLILQEANSKQKLGDLESVVNQLKHELGNSRELYNDIASKILDIVDGFGRDNVSVECKATAVQGLLFQLNYPHTCDPIKIAVCKLVQLLPALSAKAVDSAQKFVMIEHDRKQSSDQHDLSASEQESDTTASTVTTLKAELDDVREALCSKNRANKDLIGRLKEVRFHNEGLLLKTADLERNIKTKDTQMATFLKTIRNTGAQLSTKQNEIEQLRTTLERVQAGQQQNGQCGDQYDKGLYANAHKLQKVGTEDVTDKTTLCKEHYACIEALRSRVDAATQQAQQQVVNHRAEIQAMLNKISDAVQEAQQHKRDVGSRDSTIANLKQDMRRMTLNVDTELSKRDAEHEWAMEKLKEDHTHQKEKIAELEAKLIARSLPERDAASSNAVIPQSPRENMNTS